MKNNRVIVVGGGLAGLSSACTLAARGFAVTLLERNTWLGGKDALLDRSGFRFDMGPTILTLPSVLKRIFEEAGREISEYLDLVPLDPQWRCFFEDGSTLDLVSDLDRMKEILEKYSPGTGAGYEGFLKLSERLNSISDKFFFWRSLGGLWDMFSLRTSLKPGTLSDVMAMRMGATVTGTIESYIKDPRVAQMLEHFTQYVGSAPDASPAVLCGIAHMQTDEGIWYPMGGMVQIPKALERLARELGVQIRTGTGVRRILTEGLRVTGVETDSGEVLPAGAVVSNCDSVRTHRELLSGPASQRFERRRGYEPACSGVVLYLGLKRQYPQLLHHDFVFSRDPKEEFESIYRRGEPAADPTCYVCAPSRTDPSVAPKDHEALYVLVHTPYLRPHHDWSRMFPEYRNVILDKLERVAGLKDLRSQIVFESALTPQDIRDRYHVLDGAIYGLASHGRFLGAFKPANRSPDLEGLYLAGGSAHPGPGVPMVLMSGWITADTIHQDGLCIPEHMESTAAA